MTAFLVAFTLAAAPAKENPSEEFFKPTAQVPTIRVQVDKENLAKLRRDDHQYVRATLTLHDEDFVNVGMHIKGAAGSRRDWNDKPALTINSNKFVDDQTFHGMDKFHLNNSVQDEMYLNEILTGDLFRKAGVPTGRATHCFVELNGRKVGLYVFKEGYDKAFLRHYFKDVKGNLYDGGFLTDIDQNIKNSSNPNGDGKDLKALAAASRVKDPKERLAAMDKLLDIDRFVALWAIEVMCCDWDGYSRNRNNYRLYHDPATDKFVFFAHGKDQMFQNIGDPLVTGWGGLIARKLWETEEGRKLYIAKVKTVFEKQFVLDDLYKIVDDYGKRLKEPLNLWQKGAGDRYVETLKQYKNRLKARYDYLKKEIPKLKP